MYSEYFLFPVILNDLLKVALLIRSTGNRVAPNGFLPSNGYHVEFGSMSGRSREFRESENDVGCTVMRRYRQWHRNPVQMHASMSHGCCCCCCCCCCDRQFRIQQAARSARLFRGVREQPILGLAVSHHCELKSHQIIPNLKQIT